MNQVINKPKLCTVNIHGDNNVVEWKAPLGDIFKGSIDVGDSNVPAYNCRITIGPGTTANGVVISMLDDNSVLEIGKDCMFSWGIWIWSSDNHTVVDKDTRRIVNHASDKPVRIGDHVWVGLNSVITKNTEIPDNSIVGIGSVVHGKFTEPNCVIAGNPAKIVKRGIDWDRDRPNKYVREKQGGKI